MGAQMGDARSEMAHPRRAEVVTVEASPELLAQMEDQWSPPVQVRVTRCNLGWEMTFRTHECTTNPPKE